MKNIYYILTVLFVCALFSACEPDDGVDDTGLKSKSEMIDQ